MKSLELKPILVNQDLIPNLIVISTLHIQELAFTQSTWSYIISISEVIHLIDPFHSP